jgi:hypothetical protein
MMNRKQAKAQLYTWAADDRADNFHSRLYSLIAKADSENKEALRKGFPNEVAVYDEWMSENRPDLEEFWRLP